LEGENGLIVEEREEERKRRKRSGY